MKISLIAAMAENRTIGTQGKLPWHIPDDFKFFKEKTLGYPVIMGRKTFDSLGKPLPKRENAVVTRDAHLKIEGASVFLSLESALNHFRKLGRDEVFVIGGGQVYELALPVADRIYLTIVHRNFPGDAFFPEFSLRDFHETESRRVENPIPHTFKTYDR